MTRKEIMSKKKKYKYIMHTTSSMDGNITEWTDFFICNAISIFFLSPKQGTNSLSSSRVNDCNKCKSSILFSKINERKKRIRVKII